MTRLAAAGLAIFLSFALSVRAAPGDLDTTFGASGVATLPVGTSIEQIYGLALQADGKLIAVGRTGTEYDLSHAIALARYNIDGTLDASFGSGGLVAQRV